MTIDTQNNSGLDLVWEAGPIGKVLGLTARQTNYMLATGQLPAKKIGGRWCAERNQLTKFFMDQLSAEAS